MFDHRKIFKFLRKYWRIWLPPTFLIAVIIIILLVFFGGGATVDPFTYEEL